MYRINTIAVIGSGIMGSSLACHFAGIGFTVMLFDLASQEEDKNSTIKINLEKCIKAKPSNLFHSSFSKQINILNLTDNVELLQKADWVIEAIVENAEIKKSLYSQISPYLNSRCILSSNTSGILLSELSKSLNPDLQKQFLGTHFFNPPRYLKLLEIIPCPNTDPELVYYIQNFGNNFLGKETIICKDSPAFIANRIGVISMAYIFQNAAELNLQITDIDRITGEAIGRPKSGTYRLADMVGLDTANTVLYDLKSKCPDDDLLQRIIIPEYWKKLIDAKNYGDKSGKGFYHKTGEKDENQKNIIKAYNLISGEYEIQKISSYESLTLSKQIEEKDRRIKALLSCSDPIALFLKNSFGFLLAYAARCVGEICDQWCEIDKAMKNGFAWEFGPFEYWDVIGFDTGLELLTQHTSQIPDWLIKMKNDGCTSFYKIENEKLFFYNAIVQDYELMPGQEKNIRLNVLKGEKQVYKNDEMSLLDIGDNVLCLAFNSKNNIIGEGILRGIETSINIAEEKNWRGIVIGNNANNFSVGANLMLIGMFAFQQQYDQLNFAVNLFQQTSLKLRYSAIPIVAATQGYVFGGGTEFLMHCDAAVVNVESYLGLVEVAVGILPGGGGTKEFALRLSDEIKEGEIIIPQLIQKFRTLAMGQVATSAYEAFDFSYLQKHRDIVCLNHQIFKAKQKVLQLAEQYLPPIIKNDVKVLGRSGLGTLYGAVHSLLRGNYATEHDIKIAKKIAYVLCGGDLSSPQTVSEQYLLDLEREAFLSLCSEPKTLERIQYMLENNKALRN